MIDGNFDDYGREHYNDLLREADAERLVNKFNKNDGKQPLKAMLDKVGALFSSNDDKARESRTATQELRRVRG